MNIMPACGSEVPMSAALLKIDRFSSCSPKLSDAIVENGDVITFHQPLLRLGVGSVACERPRPIALPPNGASPVGSGGADSSSNMVIVESRVMRLRSDSLVAPLRRDELLCFANSGSGGTGGARSDSKL